MNDQQQSNGIPVTRFILHSVYAQSDDEKLEFDYESGSTNIVVGLLPCWNYHSYNLTGHYLMLLMYIQVNDYTSQHEIAQQVFSVLVAFDCISFFWCMDEITKK